ncbi:hypothetical protein MKX03_004218 [Papaver bracteatum]|nr:hypothetical protein MKX03_004218 [Papaver bracteatum]
MMKSAVSHVNEEFVFETCIQPRRHIHKCSIFHIPSAISISKKRLVSCFIESQGWTVGDLWNKLAEYSTQRVNGKTSVSLLSWLLPSSSTSLATKWRNGSRR